MPRRTSSSTIRFEPPLPSTPSLIARFITPQWGNGARLVRQSSVADTQNEALAQGYALVTAIRTSVARRGAKADVRAAYGVGAKTSAKVVKQLVAAITLILERAAAQPEEAAALGILKNDLTALEEDRAAISSADRAQEEKRAGAPGATKERNRTANRILGAVDEIVAAGVMEFAKEAEIRRSSRRW